MLKEMTQDQLKKALDYSPFLGLFWHLPRPAKTAHEKIWNVRYAETIAGHKRRWGIHPHQHQRTVIQSPSSRMALYDWFMAYRRNRPY